MEFKEIVKAIAFMSVGYMAAMLAGMHAMTKLSKSFDKQLDDNNNKILALMRNFYGIEKAKK